MRMVEGIHPCHSQLFVSTEFIPNDVYLGCQADGAPSNDSLKLVTGPNMGGKSTLMRQVLPTGGIVKSSIDFLDVVLVLETVTFPFIPLSWAADLTVNFHILEHFDMFPRKLWVQFDGTLFDQLFLLRKN